MDSDTATGLSTGVERRCDRATDVCAALRQRAETVARSFNHLTSPFLEPGHCAPDLQPLVLLTVRVIETCHGWLLADEETYQSGLARLSAARDRRDRAIAAVRAQMSSFRDIGLRTCRLPVVPAGATPTQPQALVAASRSVARRLKSPKLQLAPGIAAGLKLYPRLRTDFDDAVAELKTALAAVERLEHQCRANRVARDQAMAELDDQLALGGRLGRYLDALEAPPDGPQGTPRRVSPRPPQGARQKGGR